MTVLEEPEDPFIAWCHEHGYYDSDLQSEHFGEWIAEQTGWDGQQFSLTEDERHWIKRAQEIVDWLRTYAITGQDEPLRAALRCLNGLRDVPSLKID